MRWGLPIVLLMKRDLMFCQCFLRRDTRKLVERRRRRRILVTGANKQAR